MYAHPPPSPTAPASGATHANPAANRAASALSNTSRVDVFSHAQEGGGAHAAFWAHAVPHAMHATLEPGDVLLFPPGWWHAMRSEETSFSVSMWY